MSACAKAPTGAIAIRAMETASDEESLCISSLDDSIQRHAVYTPGHFDGELSVPSDSLSGTPAQTDQAMRGIVPHCVMGGRCSSSGDGNRTRVHINKIS